MWTTRQEGLRLCIGPPPGSHCQDSLPPAAPTAMHMRLVLGVSLLSCSTPATPSRRTGTQARAADLDLFAPTGSGCHRVTLPGVVHSTRSAQVCAGSAPCGADTEPSRPDIPPLRCPPRETEASRAANEIRRPAHQPPVGAHPAVCLAAGALSHALQSCRAESAGMSSVCRSASISPSTRTARTICASHTLHGCPFFSVRRSRLLHR